MRLAFTEHFIAFLRFKYDQISNLANLKFKVEIYEASHGTLFKSDYFYPTNTAGEPVYAISPVFRLQQEEWPLSRTPNGYLLRLYAYQETGGDITLIMDDIHLLPVTDYRKIGDESISLNLGFDFYTYIYDKQHLGLVYEFETATNSKLIPHRTGEVMVYPGVDQKITIGSMA